MRGALAALFLLIVGMAGCVGDEPSEAPTPTNVAEKTATPPLMTETVEGVFTASVGTPPIGPAPFTNVAHGESTGTFELPNASTLTVNLTWESTAPSRIELHLQSPDGEVSTAMMPVDQTEPLLTLSLTDPVPGTWIIGVSSEGPAASVSWRAEVSYQ